MYRTVSNDFTEEEAAQFDCNMLVFFSPSGIKSFTKNFPSLSRTMCASPPSDLPQQRL